MKISKKSWHYKVREEMHNCDWAPVQGELKPEPICSYVWYVFWGCLFLVAFSPIYLTCMGLGKLKEKFCPMTEWED